MHPRKSYCIAEHQSDHAASLRKYPPLFSAKEYPHWKVHPYWYAKKQPHALRTLLSSHPPKHLDDTAVHTATHAAQAAVISHQNTGIF